MRAITKLASNNAFRTHPKFFINLVWLGWRRKAKTRIPAIPTGYRGSKLYRLEVHMITLTNIYNIFTGIMKRMKILFHKREDDSNAK